MSHHIYLRHISFSFFLVVTGMSLKNKSFTIEIGYIYIQVVIILIYILNKNDLCVPIYIIYFAILKVISAVVCLINPLRYINF